MNKDKDAELSFELQAPTADQKAPAKKAAKKAATPKKVAKKRVATKAAAKKVSTKKSAAVKEKRTFPHYPIEDARKIAEAIKAHNGGNPWAPADVAKALGFGMSNAFFYLTGASRDYGFTIGTRESAKIELTDLGRSLVYPKNEAERKQALQHGFRNVELLAKVYDYYQGSNLPEIQYLKNTLKTEFGVGESFQDDFYELFQKNLNYLKEQGAEAPPEQSSTATIGAGEHSIILGESKNAGGLVAFVAMPFSEKSGEYPKGYFDEVLKHLITPAAVKANFNARTAKKAGSEVIQSTIVNDLDSADLVIVDLTEHNPNVLFELGMRIAFNKPVCLIRARGTGAIFDIDHMLRVYDYNPSMWPSTLATDIPGLSEHIAETWKNKDTDRSYLAILRNTKGG